MPGINPEDVTILIATGTHRTNTRAELKRMLGRNIVARYTVINHDSRDDSSLAYLGDQTRALGRDAIASRQRFRLIAASGTGSFIARVAKSTVTKAVMSATVKRSPATNSFSANRRSRSA